MCAELKGAKYVGRFTMPPEQWQRISGACKEKAKVDAAQQQTSRNRDELKEDLEVECLRQNGAVFE